MDKLQAQVILLAVGIESCVPAMSEIGRFGRRRSDSIDRGGWTLGAGMTFGPFHQAGTNL